MVVVVAKVVDKEINKALVKEVKEFNEGLEKFYLCKVKNQVQGVGVWDCWQGGDQGDRVDQQGVGRGGHKVDSGHRDDVVLDKEADVEVNQEFDREVANVFDK